MGIEKFMRFFLYDHTYLKIYFSYLFTRLSSIIRMIKSRTMRWTGHVARMGEERNAYRILVGSQKEESTGKSKV
jgi:hypothetical protein